MTTATPILNGQILGQAHHAARAVLEKALANTGIGYRQSVAMNQLAISGNSSTRQALAARMIDGLKITEDEVLETVAELAAAGLADDGETVSLTDAGVASQQQIRSAIGEVTSRLYQGLPQEELAVAAKVLIAFTARANAELAAS